MHVVDGFRDLLGGMSSGLEPYLIQPNQAALMVNLTARGGILDNRPVFKPVKINGATVTVGGSDVVQALDSYSPPNGDTPNLFAFIGGKIYFLDLSGVVTEQTIAGDPNSSTLPMGWTKQGEQYFFYQDGQSRPLIYNGSTWRRAKKSEPPDWDMPVGTAMEYAFGRMLVARGRKWVAGDINGGPTQIYQFTENSFIAEGGSWTVPIPGRITALKVMDSLDNAIGQGPFTIHTTKGICTARIDQPRLSWKDIQFQQTANQKKGAVSQNSCVNVNGDLWFRANDGWRSLVLARRDFNSWGNVPQSFEMTSVLNFDDGRLLPFAQAVLFKNWLVGTSWPTPYKSSAYHKALVGLDFAALGSLSNRVPPAWDGLWTGIYPTAITVVEINNRDRVFIIARNTMTDKNELWELVEGDFDSGDGRITQTLETAALFCPQTAPGMPTPDRQMKKLSGGEIYIQDIKGTVDFTVEYRTDQYPCWLPWTTFQLCNTYHNCAPACSVPIPYRPGFKSPIKLPTPPDSCQQGSDVPTSHGMQFQARLTWTGHCKISKFFILADTIEQSTYTPDLACAQ